MQVDSSGKAIAARLFQIDNEQKEVNIGYFSKVLHPPQRKWSIYVLEFYAIYRAFGHFYRLLKGNFTEVYTDNSAIVGELKLEKCPAKLLRWLQFLLEFSFVMLHTFQESFRQLLDLKLLALDPFRQLLDWK